MPRKLVVLTLLLAGSLATAAQAQDLRTDQQTRPPQPQTPRPTQPGPAAAPAAPKQIHFRPFVGVDFHSLAASESFNAALDSSQMTGFGAGADVWGFYRNVFARVAFATASRSGSRGFLAGNAIIQTGVALDVKITPITIGAGWRFERKPKAATLPRPGTPQPAPATPRPGAQTPPRPGPQPAAGARPAAQPMASRFTPYAGAGLVLLKYKETSDFAASGDDVSSSHNGVSVFGGVDVGITRLFVVTAEAEFRRVGHTPGPGSLSDIFGEDDLGGFGFRLLFGIRK